MKRGSLNTCVFRTRDVHREHSATLWWFYPCALDRSATRHGLNCWCNLAFEYLVIWLSLVWSWVVEIYAWSTIWNYFDLRQPQQPQIKSVKIQSCFCSFFVQILIIFLLILSLYGSIHADINSLLGKLNNMFGFCSLFISFCNTWEKNCWKRQKLFSQKCSKNLHNHGQYGILIFSCLLQCKYIWSNYGGITVYHNTSTIFRCNVPLHLNIPIAKVRYPKIYSDMIVKCQ